MVLEAVERSHEDRSTSFLYDEWGDYRPPPVTTLRRPARPDGKFLGELIDGAVERALLYPAGLEGLAARSAKACVALLYERSEGARVREFLAGLDDELVHRELCWTMGDSFASHRVRLRGGRRHEFEQTRTWYLVGPPGASHETILWRDGSPTAHILEAPKSEALAMLSEQDPRLADDIRGTIAIQAIARALFEWLPDRAPVLYGLTRLLFPCVSTFRCDFCDVDRIPRADPRPARWCRACKETVEFALLRKIPSMEMLVVEVARALEASSAPDRSSVLSMLQHQIEQATKRRRCPFCARPGDLIATSQGTICRPCIGGIRASFEAAP